MKQNHISACDHCKRLIIEKGYKTCTAGFFPSPWKTECLGYEKNNKLNKRKNNEMRNNEPTNS